MSGTKTSKQMSNTIQVATLVEKAKGSCTAMRKLASGFKPGNRDVICQRGKAAFIHNKHFRVLLEGYLERYSNASSRLEKSLVVSDVVDAVREASPDGGFVRCVGGVYYEVGDAIAREKCGGSFREMLHTKYRSSAKAKRRMKEQQKAAEQPQKPLETISSTPAQMQMQMRRVSNSSVETAAAAVASESGDAEVAPESTPSGADTKNVNNTTASADATTVNSSGDSRNNNKMQEEVALPPSSPSKKRRRVVVESSDPVVVAPSPTTTKTLNTLEDILKEITSRREELSSSSSKLLQVLEPTPLPTASDCFRPSPDHHPSTGTTTTTSFPQFGNTTTTAADEFDFMLSKIFPVEL